MRVALLGDVALFGRCNTPEYFNEISEYLSSFDYVVGNLETPFSSSHKTYGAKSAYICAESKYAPLLKQLHINAVTLANNHMYDYGKEGFELTQRLLSENGIDFFGINGKDLKVEVGNNHLRFLGFCCYTTNPLNVVAYGKAGINEYNLKKAKDMVSESNDAGYLPIISVHAGLEHVNYPSREHVKAARILAEEGRYVYYGHHPHVVQGVEEFKDSLIAHSLGNFCFDDVYGSSSTSEPLVVLSDNNRLGMILELTIEDNKVTAWKEQLIIIGKDEGVRLVSEAKQLEEYNNLLIHCEETPKEYDQMRMRIINAWTLDRKVKRNISWYVKRLRPRYVKLLFDMRKNVKRYNKSVKRFII